MSQSQCARSSRRGPRGEAGAARAAILAAARSLFLAGDFQSVSLRAIAREAEVDTSLVSYYFGSKQSLYNEAMSLPNGPHRIIAEVCSRTDPDHLGEALVKAFIDAWDSHLGLGGPDPQMQGVVQALLTQPDAFDMMRQFYTEEILAPVVNLLIPPIRCRRGGDTGLSWTLAIAGDFHGSLRRWVAVPSESSGGRTHRPGRACPTEHPHWTGYQRLTLFAAGGVGSLTVVPRLAIESVSYTHLTLPTNREV